MISFNWIENLAGNQKNELAAKLAKDSAASKYTAESQHRMTKKCFSTNFIQRKSETVVK